MSEKKDYKVEKKPEIQKQKIPETGILKEKEKKDLEDKIVDTLKKLNSGLTKKEIMSLFNKIEASKWLEWLKKDLQKEIKIWGKEIPEEILRSILDLINESKEITLKWIEELKIELGKVLNESKEYEIDTQVYFTSKFKFIKKLEESELWKNIILDIAGVTVWALDSAQAIFKLLLWLIKDLLLLPRDIARKIKK
ncbi:MAG: hypothetical protein ACD_49C00051G0021 [uncultured bacterium (gcode 4)]|uniref:Uncharacterized protein n=1 Tax=uncultured bacterium (gcode 4) TaxID=1234023 RepID=K2AX08_9BACT|nr:MAG: hypothetical protein ACD_49C00051G0021 [uncultured bacterium (gcode 4)]